MDAFHGRLLGEDNQKSASDLGIKGAGNVRLFCDFGGECVKVPSADVSNVGRDYPENMPLTLHHHYLEIGEGIDMVVVRGIEVATEHRLIRYPYTFQKNEEVPSRLRNFFTGGFYVWDTQAMKPVDIARNPVIEITSQLDLTGIRNLAEDDS